MKMKGKGSGVTPTPVYFSWICLPPLPPIFILQRYINLMKEREVIK